MRLRFALSILSAFSIAIALAASASASSIVYINGGNVWLANPDGSGQYQVTLDGTTSEPYSSPSQAQDGTIGVERAGKIYRMTQNGTLLNAPFTTAAVGTPPLDPLISPDGSMVSFYSITTVNPCYPLFCVETANSYQISAADHWVDPRTFAPKAGGWSSFSNPSWMSNSRELLSTRNGDVWYYDLGQAEPVEWFEWPGVLPVGGSGQTGFWDEGSASPDGTRLALLTLSELTHRYEIQIYTASGDLASGNPPALPQARCAIEPPDGSVGTNTGTYPGSGSLFDSMSWSPDGSSLVYEYSGAVYVAHLTDLEECESKGNTVTQVIPAGSDPNWGPANVNPAPRPVSAPAPNSGPPAGSGVNSANVKPAIVTPIPHEVSPCSGLAETGLQICRAKLNYHSALAGCDRKYHGKSKREKAKDAACRDKATVAYHRALALIKCSKLTNKHKHAVCVQQANRSH